MSKFKVGDKVQEHVFQNPILTIEHVNGPLIMFEDEGHHRHEAHYKLVPVYPNPPLSHSELRIEHAKGANIEVIDNFGQWSYIAKPGWFDTCYYRVKKEKTKHELRIDKLEKMINDHKVAINIFNQELSHLKPKINY